MHDGADYRLAASLPDQWVVRLRADYPAAVAILLKGSYARGKAGPHSDVDFDVLLAGEPCEDYPMHLIEDDDGKLRHVSIAVQDIAGWLAEGDEPEPWAYGFGVRAATRLLWAADAALAVRLDRPWREHPPGEPELEDFVEGLGKVKNALGRGDEVGVRQAAQVLARLAPGLLRLLNPEVWVGTPREALAAALALPVAPPGYRDDLCRCLGLAQAASTAGEIAAAAERLVTGVVRLLAPRAREFASERPGDPFRRLADGSLERYVRQVVVYRPSAS